MKTCMYSHLEYVEWAWKISFYETFFSFGKYQYMMISLNRNKWANKSVGDQNRGIYSMKNQNMYYKNNWNSYKMFRILFLFHVSLVIISMNWTIFLFIFSFIFKSNDFPTEDHTPQTNEHHIPIKKWSSIKVF